MDLPRIPEPRRTLYRRTFYAAAIYNALWGVAVILFPRQPFALVGVPIEKVGDIGVLFWQCIGMFVMVFAIGYFVAARQPERYAAFILIGLIGKVCGPIGFLYGCLWLGTMPGVVGLTLLTNDLAWWPIFVPFVWETCVRRRYGPLV